MEQRIGATGDASGRGHNTPSPAGPGNRIASTPRPKVRCDPGSASHARIHNRLLRTCTAVLLAWSLLAGSAHAQYDGIHFFGDSLTDSGAFTSLVTFGGAPDANKFINNPGAVWAQHLGTRYGLVVTPGYALDLGTLQFVATGGNNFAIGGARITQQPGVFSLDGNPALGDAIAAAIVPLSGQVAASLAQTGGNAGTNTLYLYWGGANDVFVQAGAIGMGLPIPNAAANLAAAATEAAAQVNQLRAAGASRIVVIAVPDIGITPFAAASPPGTGPLLSALSDAYNSALQQGLTAAGTTGIVYFDPRPLIADMHARPAAYGITNTTIPACGAAASLGCGPGQQIPGSGTHFYADGVHPTSAVHGILSDWVYGSLTAPSQLAVLPTIPLGRLGAQWRAIDNRIRDFATSAGERGFYVTGDYAPARIDATTAAPSLKGHGRTISIGIDHAYGDAMLGASAGLAQHDYKLGGAGGSIDYSEVVFSGYGAVRFGAAYLDATLSYAGLDFDVQRNIALGPLVLPNQGSTSGTHAGLKIGGGYNFSWNSTLHGPVAALSWERVSVDGYTEVSGPTAMTFGSQTSRSLRHRLGWQFVGNVPSEWGRVRPYARLTHEKEYEDNRRAVTAGMAGTPFTFSTQAGGTKDGWGLLAAGVAVERKDFNVHAGLTTTVGKSGAREHAVMVGVSVPLR